MDLESTIVNLNVIAQLKKGQKLCTRGEYLDIEAQCLVPECIRRWRRQDSRNDMVLALNKIINEAIRQDVSRYLDKTIVGLENLKHTYAHCKQTVARLDMITDKIHAQKKEVDE
jgi:hypothetical protein